MNDDGTMRQYREALARQQATIDAGQVARDHIKALEERIAALTEALDASTAAYRILNDVHQAVSDHRATLAERIAALEAAMEALSGSPKDMLDFCQAHGLEFMKPEPVADTWRKSIARFALAGAR